MSTDNPYDAFFEQQAPAQNPQPATPPAPEPVPAAAPVAGAAASENPYDAFFEQQAPAPAPTPEVVQHVRGRRLGLGQQRRWKVVTGREVVEGLGVLLANELRGDRGVAEGHVVVAVAE